MVRGRNAPRIVMTQEVTFEQSMEMMKLAHSQQMEMLNKLIELKNMHLGQPTVLKEVSEDDEVS